VPEGVDYNKGLDYSFLNVLCLQVAFVETDCKEA